MAPPRAARLLLAGLLASLWSTATHASFGDAQPPFRRCVADCVATGCAAPGDCAPSCGAAGGAGDPALALLCWDCQADCRYRCMHAAERERAGGAVKYFGKWPFVRRLGMQEPASVAFSLANLWAHARGYARLRRALPRAHPLRPLWAGYAALSANAWVWSAVFHCRDTRATERLDYFSADALLVYSLFAALVRAGSLTRPRQWLPLAALLAGGLAAHVRRMLLVRFDYGANVALCVALGAAQSATWLAFAFAGGRGAAGAHPARWRLARVVGAAHAASLLELLDFPPLAGALDAHALWHAATPPLTLAWYAFLADDARLVPLGKPKDGA